MLEQLSNIGVLLMVVGTLLGVYSVTKGEIDKWLRK